MDIKQLKFLIALDETRHFGQAAARCNITQPTLSMRLRNTGQSSTYLGSWSIKRE